MERSMTSEGPPLDQCIDGTRSEPAPVGQVVDWTFRLGPEPPRRWDWSAGAPDVRVLAPIRTPRSTEKSRHIPVQAHCFLTQTMLTLESGLEYDLLLMVERDPEAVWVVPQPARLHITIPNGRRTVHTPDLLVIDKDGQVTIWNARSSERQDNKFLAQSRATEVACHEVGWRYEVFPGHSRVKRYNLRWLAAYRSSMPWHAAGKSTLVEICRRPAPTIGHVLGVDRGSGHLVSALWHYAWRGELAVDLELTTRRSTPIAWVGEPADD